MHVYHSQDRLLSFLRGECPGVFDGPYSAIEEETEYICRYGRTLDEHGLWNNNHALMAERNEDILRRLERDCTIIESSSSNSSRISMMIKMKGDWTMRFLLITCYPVKIVFCSFHVWNNKTGTDDRHDLVVTGSDYASLIYEMREKVLEIKTSF